MVQWWFTGQYLTDTVTALKLFRAPAIKGLELRTNGFELDHEITSRILGRGCTIREVPIRYYPRSREEGRRSDSATGSSPSGLTRDTPAPDDAAVDYDRDRKRSRTAIPIERNRRPPRSAAPDSVTSQRTAPGSPSHRPGGAAATIAGNG